MLKSYCRTALLFFQRNKTHSFINIAGLSVGMAVAMLIGLWIWDEISFDKYHRNYDRIAEVMHQQTIHGSIATSRVIPVPLETELRKNYKSDFKHIVLTSHTEMHILAAGDKTVSYSGGFMGPEGPEMFTVHMLKGASGGLKYHRAFVF